MLSYPTKLFFYDKNMKTAKKLPLNTNIFLKNPDDTIFLITTKGNNKKTLCCNKLSNYCCHTVSVNSAEPR